MEQKLQILENVQLFLKKYKCSFGVVEVKYLCHIANIGGLKAYPKKINAMQEWPLQFSGLAGYYRKFAKDYENFALPLTELAKKETATRAFTTLKEPKFSTLVLATSNFTLQFVIKYNVLGARNGAAFMQECHP